MAEQNFKNHTRLDPVYHLLTMPILLANVVIAVVRCVRHPNAWHGWNIVLALALLVLAGLVRTYALRVQNRVILLEQRIRMAALLPLEMHPLQKELTAGQLIALRFASDRELASLTERAIREKLTSKAIKQSIQVWRPDTHRV